MPLCLIWLGGKRRSHHLLCSYHGHDRWYPYKGTHKGIAVEVCLNYGTITALKWKCQIQQLWAPLSSPIKLLGQRMISQCSVPELSGVIIEVRRAQLQSSLQVLQCFYLYLHSTLFRTALRDSLRVVWCHTSASPPIGIKSYFSFLTQSLNPEFCRNTHSLYIGHS